MFDQQKLEMEQQIGNAPAEGTQETAPQQATEEIQAAPEAKSPQEIADLAKLSKFMLDGKEYTYDELKKERMRLEDYTRKTQELAEKRKTFETESKYAVNFDKDLEVLMAQPWRADEFRKLYPKEYHRHADKIERLYKQAPALWSTSETQDQGQQRSTQQPDIKKLIEETVSERLRPMEEKEARDAERTYLAEMDARETKLMQKYKRANKFEVYAAAEYLSKEGEDGQPKQLADQDWEKLFKDSHERTVAMIKEARADEFNQQKQANKQLKDVQSGGGVPGEAPVVPRSLKEAKEHFLRMNEG